MKNCEKESIASKSLSKKVAIATRNIKHTQRQLHNRKIQKANGTTRGFVQHRFHCMSCGRNESLVVICRFSFLRQVCIILFRLMLRLKVRQYVLRCQCHQSSPKVNLCQHKFQSSLVFLFCLLREMR